MEAKYRELNSMQIGAVLIDEPLKQHTTMKVGGPADIMVIPNSLEGLEKTATFAKEHNLHLTVIGRGSNLLVSDEGIRGIVVKLANNLNHLEVNETEVIVGSGYPLITLATLLTKQGLTGLEFAAGIPASIGGAVYMNAGAHGSDMANIVSRARVLFEDGTLEWLTNEDLEFSYRTSILQNQRPGFCIEVELQLSKGDKSSMTQNIHKYKEYRKVTQPWNHPCCGSVFRNPLPQYAGQLIEEAGLKGHQIGGAKVSNRHANFIVNTGNAKAEDVKELISYIQSVIYKKHKIALETEVEFLGEFDFI